MDFGLFKAIREEWPVMKTAPWSFATVFLVALAIGFGVATLWWSGTVSALRERLSFAQDRLQVALAAPANPAALLTKPQDDGRRLSGVQSQCLISKFKDESKNFLAIIITAFPNDESQRFANDFLMVFLRMGYQSGIFPGQPKNFDDISIIVGLKDPDNPSEAAKKFKTLVGSCVSVNDRSLKWDPSPALLPQFSSVDFDLFIGPKD